MSDSELASGSGSEAGDAASREDLERRREDEFQIRDLACRYARMVDRREWNAIDEVFTEDAELSGPGYVMRGHAELVEGLSSIDRYSATMHCIHNQLCEIDGDIGWGEFYCVANHLHKIESEPWKLDMGIRYEDRYRRTKDGWRITKRVLHVIWQQEARLS